MPFSLQHVDFECIVHSNAAIFGSMIPSFVPMKTGLLATQKKCTSTQKELQELDTLKFLSVVECIKQKKERKLHHSHMVSMGGTIPQLVKGEMGASQAGGDSGCLFPMFGQTGLCRTYGNSLLGKIY